MPDTISILRANLFPLDRYRDLANREQRMDRVHAEVRGLPGRRGGAFVAGEECDGVIPVTIARWRSDDSAEVIDSWEMCFTTECWDPLWLRNQLDQLDQEVGA